MIELGKFPLDGTEGAGFPIHESFAGVHHLIRVDEYETYRVKRCLTGIFMCKHTLHALRSSVRSYLVLDLRTTSSDRAISTMR